MKKNSELQAKEKQEKKHGSGPSSAGKFDAKRPNSPSVKHRKSKP